MSVIRRPQRKPTAAELDVVNGTALLNLQGALIMGIVDPVPNPSPMSEEEGAWVRTHVWPTFLQDIDRKYPWGFWRWSYCEKGTCWNCLNHRCDLCIHRQHGRPDVDDDLESVHNHRGRHIAWLIERPNGEPCVWWCRCPCPKTGEAPAKPKRRRAEPAPSPAVAPPRPAPFVPSNQTTLFEPEAIPQ